MNVVASYDRVVTMAVIYFNGCTLLRISEVFDLEVLDFNEITTDTIASAKFESPGDAIATIYFGTLGSGAARFASSSNPLGDTVDATSSHTLAVGTNAPSGFTISVRGQTLTSLQNASNTITAIGASAASSTPGSEQFGIRAIESGGTGTAVAVPYSSATSYGYSATATTSATLATGTGATQTSTYSMRYVANIAALTEAGTYAASIVYVATANF